MAEPLPTNHKELIEERAKCLADAQKIVDAASAEGRGILNTEEKASFDALTSRAKDAQAALQHRQNLAAFSEMGQLTPVMPVAGSDGSFADNARAELHREEVRRELALNAYVRHRALTSKGKFLSEESRQAMQELSINPLAGDHLLGRRCSAQQVRFLQHQARSGKDPEGMLAALEESRSLGVSIGAQGGAVVPQTFIRRLEANMLFYGGMMQVGEIIRTAGGNEMRWPTFNDTANEGRRIGAATAPANNIEPAFGQLVWRAHKYTSEELLIDYETLEDADVDILGVIANALGERLGRILNKELTLGTGGNMPNGIVNAAEVGATAATATGLTSDDLVRLFRSVDPAYRNGAGFMMHDNVLMELWLLKDSTGQPLFQASYREGQPDRILGRPVAINSNMASSLTASADTILFGQLRQYKIREVNDIRFYRLIERHRETDQDAFLAFVRVDGNLLNAGTCPVKKLRQAAS